MAANTGPAEHALEAPGAEREHEVEMESHGQGREDELLRVPPASLPARHLYIVHSSDFPQRYSNWAKPAPVATSSPIPTSKLSKGMLDRSVQVQIGRMLRDVFADVAEEQVPERFVTLLEALEAKEKQS
jgi:Anti-sigma factor NepR